MKDKDIYELKANKYILKYRRLLQDIVGGVKELPLTYLLRDIRYMIKKIQDTDNKIYQNFKYKFDMPMDYTDTVDQMDKLEKILEPFQNYSYIIFTALEDLINAFNNSKLYSKYLPKFTEFPILPNLDDLLRHNKLPDLPKKSINTNMLNVFLKTIEDINYLNDEKIKNKYDRELQKLKFVIK